MADHSLHLTAGPLEASVGSAHEPQAGGADHPFSFDAALGVYLWRGRTTLDTLDDTQGVLYALHTCDVALQKYADFWNIMSDMPDDSDKAMASRIADEARLLGRHARVVLAGLAGKSILADEE